MNALAGAGRRLRTARAPESAHGTGLDAAEVYALGADPEESARLRRQSQELRPEAEALLARIGLRPGQAAADLGCGPYGILDLLSGAVSPGGRVLGLDADPVHVAMAREHAEAAGLASAEVITIRLAAP